MDLPQSVITATNSIKISHFSNIPQFRLENIGEIAPIWNDPFFDSKLGPSSLPHTVLARHWLGSSKGGTGDYPHSSLVQAVCYLMNYYEGNMQDLHNILRLAYQSTGCSFLSHCPQPHTVVQCSVYIIFVPFEDFCDLGAILIW